MAFDEVLATRLRDEFVGESAIEEKKMFGGIAFMRRGHMCVGVVNDDLLARVGPEAHGKAVVRDGARVMDFTGKKMKGFIFVSPESLVEDGALSGWVDLCRVFNDSMPSR
jgi:hypothetical protein